MMNPSLNYDRPISSSQFGDLTACASASGNHLIERLLRSGILMMEDWQQIKDDLREDILDARSTEDLLNRLVNAELLTAYQASRLQANPSEQLILGNYRILERIGSGGMGVVYRGEHALLRRPVAIKVMQSPADEDHVLLQRFFVEMRALARIRHPNIVWALDAGTIKPTEHSHLCTHYLVMEHVIGMDLEQIVANGPLNISQACELIYQIASALDETHKLGLVHRDVKPSNILVAKDGTGKLLDFGLALHFSRRRLTVPGTLLGTINYMAPEQVADAANVDVRTDIFGLGATFFYCLTGKQPFPTSGSVIHQVASRLTQPAPELRIHRPDVSPDLEAIIRRMMANHRDDRYATPQSVMRALLPYVNATADFKASCRSGPITSILPNSEPQVPTRPDATRVLLVDDEKLVRDLCKHFFRKEGFECTEACDGVEGLALTKDQPFDLVVLDIDMPNMSGKETLRRLRNSPTTGNLKVIMMSGGVDSDEMSEQLELGADDYIGKPLSRQQLVARAKMALMHKAAQDRSDALNKQLLQVNADLEQSLSTRNSDLIQARNALIYALAKIVESRSKESDGHLLRMKHFVVTLAQHARRLPRFANEIDGAFLQTLEACVILHDIGNVAMPDHLLQSSDEWDDEDTVILQSHTTIGADTLRTVAKNDRSAGAFWQMAIDIARHHHERFDGNGYPDRLQGVEIPLSARLVALADAYETLRATAAVGRALSHNAAVEFMLQGSHGHFDPLLLEAFSQCAGEFDAIFRTFPEESTGATVPGFE